MGNIISMRDTSNSVSKRIFVKFDNGYAASVITKSFDELSGIDMREIAIMKSDMNGEYYIDYDTPITDDVIPFNTEEEALEILQRISRL